MKWSYLSLEGYCNHPSENYEDAPCSGDVPGKISIICFGSEYKNEMCKYFGCKKSRSCLLVNNENGDVIKGYGFSCDSEVDTVKWLRKEQDWIQEC